MAYAEIADIQGRLQRDIGSSESGIISNLLEDAAIIIDTFAPDADADAKKIVSIRMVMRSVGDGDSAMSFPLGTTQGSMAALGYSQSFTVGASGGGVGELYLTKLEKQMLGIVSNKIGSHSPLEDQTGRCCPNWWGECND